MRWAIEDTSGHLVDKDLWLPLEGAERDFDGADG